MFVFQGGLLTFAGAVADSRFSQFCILPSRRLQPFQVHPAAADLGKVVLGLLHKPAIFGAAKDLR